MTEPQDRERAEFHRCPDCDKPLEPCGSCPQCGEYPDSPCHKAYLEWGGWKGPAPMWDTFRTGWQAARREERKRTLEECIAIGEKWANGGKLDTHAARYGASCVTDSIESLLAALKGEGNGRDQE